MGGSFITTWLYFVTAVDGIADPEAAPIFDAQVAKWLQAQGLASLRVDRTSDYEKYLELLKDWGQQMERTPARAEAGIFHLATGSVRRAAWVEVRLASTVSGCATFG